MKEEKETLKNKSGKKFENPFSLLMTSWTENFSN